jgi:hypothetical protein
VKKIPDIVIDADVSHAKHRKHWLEGWDEADVMDYFGYIPEHVGADDEEEAPNNPFTDYKIGDFVEVYFDQVEEYLSAKIIGIATDLVPIMYKVEGPNGMTQWTEHIFETDVGHE